MIYEIWCMIYDILMAEILTQIEPAQQSWATVAGTWHLVDENFQRFKTRKCVSEKWHFLEPAILNCWEVCSYVLMLMHSVWAVRNSETSEKQSKTTVRISVAPIAGDVGTQQNKISTLLWCHTVSLESSGWDRVSLESRRERRKNNIGRSLDEWTIVI